MPFGSEEGRRRTQQRRAQASTSRALKTNPTTAGIAAKNPRARRFTAERVKTKFAGRRGGRLFQGGFSGGGQGAGAPKTGTRGGARGRPLANPPSGRGAGGGGRGGNIARGRGGSGDSALFGFNLGPAGGSAKAPTGTKSTSLDSFSRGLERKFDQRSRRRRRA